MKQIDKKIRVTVSTLVDPKQIEDDPVKVLVVIQDESTAAVLD